MKIAIIYTSTTPELIDLVEREVHRNFPESAVIVSYQDPSILAETREAGIVTKYAVARLVGMFMKAVEDGADVILNACSSVGLVADAVQEIARLIKVPIVRIDEEMCRHSVRKGTRIGVLATLPTTLEPTKATVRRAAAEMEKEVILVDGLLDGAFGLDQEAFKALLISKALEIRDRVDVILLAQGSMAYCESVLEEACGIPVLSSPRYGARMLKEAAERRG